MDVNEKQVGGNHYKTAFQHWDFISVLNVAYLPAQVMKYLSRWRKKNGLEDLEKALHFLEKFTEQEHQRHSDALALTNNFVSSNNLGPEERSVCAMLINYQLGDGDRLLMAQAAIKRTIDTEKARHISES